MKTNGNYHQLWLTHRDFDTFTPGMRYIYASKINEFYQKYGLRINTIIQAVNDLIKKYVQHDTDMKPIIKEVNGKQEYQFENDNYKAMYLAAYNELMSTNVVIT